MFVVKKDCFKEVILSRNLNKIWGVIGRGGNIFVSCGVVFFLGKGRE